MSKRIFVVMVLAALLIASACELGLAAAVPTQLTIQGVLLTSGGNPPSAGNKTFTFRIFDLWSGGTQVWPTPPPIGEEQIVATDQGGRWTAQVGAVVPLSASVFDGAERWLDITVTDGVNPPETVTRIPINASPYAYRVATIQGADAGDLQGVMGVRDPGGDDSLLIGPGGMTFHTSGESATGPLGIMFVGGEAGTDTIIRLAASNDALPQLTMCAKGGVGGNDFRVALGPDSGLTFRQTTSGFTHLGLDGIVIHGDTGTISVLADIDAVPRQFLLTTADVERGGYCNRGPALVLRDSSADMPEKQVLLSAADGFAMSGDTGTSSWARIGNTLGGSPRQLLLTTSDVERAGYTNHGPALILLDSTGILTPASELWLSPTDGIRWPRIGAAGTHFGPSGLLMTDSVGDTSLMVISQDNVAMVGINTGHPSEALTVRGAIRGFYDDSSGGAHDPWVSARKALVIAKEGADEWGRSVDGDSAGIYFPADNDDFSIMSSKALVDKTEMRISVGDDPDDHILLMPSGNVGISTTNPIEKLDVAGNIRAGKIALGGALIDATRALTAVDNIATSDWGMGVRNTGGGARVSISAVPTNLAAITLLSNGSDRWFLGKGVGAENFFISSNVAGTVLTIDRATGYLGLGTGAPAHPLELASGAHCTVGGTWTNASDSALKTNFYTIDGNELLSRVARLRIQQWNYRAEDASIRHIGPMAQDFYAAFGVGEDDKHITTIDADGVALAAIQALNQKLNEQKSENEELRARLVELQTLVERMMAEKK